MLVLLAPLIAIAAVALIALLLRLQHSRQAQLIGRVVSVVESRSRPSILYFTGEQCVVCHTAQRPALDALAARFGGELRIDEIDVARQPELARAYRVMSLPTTIVLAPDGSIAAVNAGFAGAERLEQQLVDAAPAVSAA